MLNDCFVVAGSDAGVQGRIKSIVKDPTNSLILKIEGFLFDLSTLMALVKALYFKDWRLN